MKKHFLALFFLILTCSLHAQKEAAIWYFGQNAGLDFNSGTPVALTDGQLNTNEGCATIADSNGNLLFYTDGITIWNRNHLVMPNGTGLNGDPSSTQSAIIVPKSDEPNLYFLFTVDDVGGPNGLQYSIVDMNLNGGLGDVTAQKTIPLISPVSEKITAVAHTDGEGVWVIARSFGGNSYYSFLVDASGVSTTPVVTNIGPTLTQSNQESQGYLKTSSDGSLLVSATSYAGYVDLMHFNAATGTLSDHISLKGFFDTLHNGSSRPYGVEFSLNNQVLYVAIRYYMYQFDLSNYNQNAIITSGLALESRDYYYKGALQMAPDGKIYETTANSTYLNVINNPNVLGIGCDYDEDVVYLGPNAHALLGLPPFITSFFYVGIEAENVCLGNTTEFKIDVSEPIASISWDFGDGNTSTQETPSHTYAFAGDYTVAVTGMTATDSFTEIKEITIYEIPVANPVTDYEICHTMDTYQFDLSTKNAEVLGVQLASENTITYYPTAPDAQNGTNALPYLYTNTLTTETIFARIQHAYNSDCFDIASFDLIVKKAPISHPVTDWIVCDTDADGLFNFDLTQKNNEILNGQDAATFTISYHESAPDADNNLNPIGPNHTNTAASQPLFYRIMNTVYPECYETGSFQIGVIIAITANAPTDMEVCDTDNDGFHNFDLSSRNTQILGGQSPANFNVSYHSSQNDANNRANPLAQTNYINGTASSETIYTRVENSSNSLCYNTTSFELIVHDSPVLQTVTNWQACDTDNDGIQTFDLSQKDGEILGAQSPTDFTVTYYETPVDAQLDQNTISGMFQNTTNPQIIFYRLENNAASTCFLTDSFVLEVFDTPVANTPTPIIVCDTDETGIQTFALSQKDNEILNGQNPVDFEVSYFANQADADNSESPLSKTAHINSLAQEIIYARIENTRLNICYTLTDFEIIVNPLPQPQLEETYVICPDSPDLVVDGGDFETWSWRNTAGNEISSDRNLNILALGNYSLTVSQTRNGISCEKTVGFEVVSSGAPDAFTVDIQGFSDNVTLEIEATGIGEFEYSIDGEIFQDSNRFEVFPGEYTVYVRDRFLCRTIDKEILVLGYQKFFTPNNDGINDHWSIIGAEKYPASQLYIYDRYGKLLKQVSPVSLGWDGTLNGVKVPSSDYWFQFINEDGKVFTGHFSLKR